MTGKGSPSLGFQLLELIPWTLLLQGIPEILALPFPDSVTEEGSIEKD